MLSDNSPGTTLVNIPILSLEPTEQITQLIDYILTRQFLLEQLNCIEYNRSFQIRLKQFLLGSCLDGLMLTKILQVLYRGLGLSIQDLYIVDTTLIAIDQDLLETYNTLVLLVYINNEDQISSLVERNDQVFIVVDWKCSQFTLVGIDEVLTKDWKAKMEGLLNAQLFYNSQKVGIGYST